MTEMLSDLITVLGSTMRLSTPLLLACLAGLFSERAGIFDIGLEGKMLSAAFFSAALAAITGSVWMGLAAGIAAALLLSVIHGLASVTFRGNQLISGVAINFLAAGMTVLVAQSWFKQGGGRPLWWVMGDLMELISPLLMRSAVFRFLERSIRICCLGIPSSFTLPF